MRHISLLLLPLTAASLLAACGDDSNGDGGGVLFINEQAEGAAPVQPGEGMRGALSDASDADAFQVTMQAGQVLEVTVGEIGAGDVVLTWSGAADNDEASIFASDRSADDLRAGDRVEFFAPADGDYLLVWASYGDVSGVGYQATLSAVRDLAPAAASAPAELDVPALKVGAVRVTLDTPQGVFAALTSTSEGAPAYASVYRWDEAAQRLEVLDYVDHAFPDLPTINTVGAQLPAGEHVLLVHPSRASRASTFHLAVRAADDGPGLPTATLLPDATAEGALSAGDEDYIALDLEDSTAEAFRVEVRGDAAAELEVTLLLHTAPTQTATAEGGLAAMEFAAVDFERYYLTLAIRSRSGQAADYEVQLSPVTWTAAAPLTLDAPITATAPHGGFAWYSFTPPSLGVLLSDLREEDAQAAVAGGGTSSWRYPATVSMAHLIRTDTNPILWGVRHSTFLPATLTAERVRFVPLDLDALTPQYLDTGALTLDPGPAWVSASFSDTAEVDFTVTLPVPADQPLLLVLDAYGEAPDTLDLATDATVVGTWEGVYGAGLVRVWELESTTATTATLALTSECRLVTDQNAVVYACPVDGFELYVTTP